MPLAGSPFLTGGTGWFDPTYAVGPFDADGIMAVDRRSGTLFVPNGGSDTVAALHMKPNGTVVPLAGSPVAVAGDTPEALALRFRTLVVVSNGLDPLQAGPHATASYISGRVDDGEFLPHGTPIARPVTTTPTQAKPIPDTPYVMTNEFTGGTISTYFLDFSGSLHLVTRRSVPLATGETSAPPPLGLAVHPGGKYVYVGLPTASHIAVFSVDWAGHLTFVRRVANSGVAVCWLTITKDGKRMYTTNTGDNSVSVYDLSNANDPVEIAHLLLHDAKGGSFQLALDPTEHFLYTVEEENAPAAAGLSNKIHILSTNRATGVPIEIAASPVALPVPAGNRPQGLIVF